MTQHMLEQLTCLKNKCLFNCLVNWIKTTDLISTVGSRHAYFDGFQIAAVSFIADFLSDFAVLFLT